MSVGLPRYLRRAFGFRPFGMLFPPHLAVLAGFGLLGALNPGFWLIGAGLELTYLLAMVSHPRFRALVDREGDRPAEDELERAIAGLSSSDRRRFEQLRARCERFSALRAEAHEADALSGLLQVHLGLLVARTSLARLVATADTTVPVRLDELDRRLDGEGIDAELQRSLEGQRAVLARRAETRTEAERKLEFVEAELTRVEDEVALLGEQAELDAGPTTGASDRVDAIATGLAETRRWLDAESAAGGSEKVPLPLIRARRSESG